MSDCGDEERWDWLTANQRKKPVRELDELLTPQDREWLKAMKVNADEPEAGQ